jgi:hypothetical protein
MNLMTEYIAADRVRESHERADRARKARAARNSGAKSRQGQARLRGVFIRPSSRLFRHGVSLPRP